MTHEKHSPAAWRKTAGAVICGFTLLVLSMIVEFLAGWHWIDIVQSVLATFVILSMALIRVKARTKSEDRLWVTALAALATDRVADWAAGVHDADAAEKRRAEAEAEAAEAMKVDTTELAERGEAEGGSGIGSGMEERAADAPLSPLPELKVEEPTETVVTAQTTVIERDGARVKINGIWRKEQH